MSLYKSKYSSEGKNNLQLMQKGGGGVGIKPKESNRNFIDEEEIKFDMTNLSKIRMIVECPICIDIIRKTTITKCGHRFCKECIEKSMRLRNHNCPSCRVHLPTRRSLRADENLDRFISIMYPDDNQYEKEELELNETERIHNEQTKTTTSQTLKLQSEPNSSKRSTIVETPRGDETIRRRIYSRGMRKVRRHEYSDDEGNDASRNHHVQVRGLTTSQPSEHRIIILDSSLQSGANGQTTVMSSNDKSKASCSASDDICLTQAADDSDENGSEDSEEDYSGTSRTPLILPQSLKWGRSIMRSSSIRKRNIRRNRIERLVAFLPNWIGAISKVQMDSQSRGWYGVVTNEMPLVLPESLKWGRSSMRSSIIRKRNLQRNRIERLVALLQNLEKTQEEMDF